MRQCQLCGAVYSFDSSSTSCQIDGGPLLIVKDDMVGLTILAQYEIRQLLGRGSWGSVYKAFDLVLQRDVAIKILHNFLVGQVDRIQRFQNEAKIISQLANKNITALHESGVLDNGQPYFVMEYLKGISLKEQLDQAKRLSPKKTIAIMEQICDGLNYAHSNGVYHRDLKPDNIFISSEGDVKLLDFGLAKSADSSASLSATGAVIGTPDYMSPEQCLGEKIDQRSDIYSLGVLMYKMLTGKTPFDGENVFAAINHCVNTKPAAISVVCPEIYFPPRLESIVLKCLEKKQEDRFRDCLTLKAALQAILADSLGVYGSLDSNRKNGPEKEIKDFQLGYKWSSIFVGAVLAITTAFFLLQSKPSGVSKSITRTNIDRTNIGRASATRISKVASPQPASVNFPVAERLAVASIESNAASKKIHADEKATEKLSSITKPRQQRVTLVRSISSSADNTIRDANRKLPYHAPLDAAATVKSTTNFKNSEHTNALLQPPLTHTVTSPETSPVIAASISGGGYRTAKQLDQNANAPNFENTIVFSPDADNNLLEGKRLTKAKLFRDAVKVYEHILIYHDTDEQRQKAILGLVDATWGTQEYRQTVINCSKYLATNTTGSGAEHCLMMRGRAREMLKDYDKAIEDFSAVIDNKSSPNQIKFGYIFRASCYEAVGKTQLAQNDKLRAAGN